MRIEQLSSTFTVRRLDAKDVETVYDLSIRNEIFYQYHPPFVTRESILRDMEALPPGKEPGDKFYIGFFKGELLVAVMDLILAYPDQNTGFIGLFMMNSKYQNKGIGSRIIAEFAECLKMSGFKKIRLGVDKGNPQSNAFWKKNGFAVTGKGEYIIMELAL